MKKALFCSITVIAFFTVFSISVSAQTCKYCKALFHGFTCATVDAQNRSGGCSCVAGRTCFLESPCTSSIECDSFTGACDKSKQLNAESNVLIDDKSIFEIGQLFPRMAVALMTLNKHGGLKNRATIYTLPVEILASELTGWADLIKEENPDISKAPEFLTSKMDASQNPPGFIFGFTAVDKTKSTIKGVVLESFSKDPKYKAVEIEIADGKVINWKLD